jgi:hypothetical protein
MLHVNIYDTFAATMLEETAMIAASSAEKTSFVLFQALVHARQNSPKFVTRPGVTLRQVSHQLWSDARHCIMVWTTSNPAKHAANQQLLFAQSAYSNTIPVTD